MPTPVRLQPVEIAVDLDGDAVRRTSLLLDLLSSTVGAPVSGDDEIGRGSDAIGFQDVHVRGLAGGIADDPGVSPADTDTNSPTSSAMSAIWLTAP